jgi:hypothetical protein
VLHLGDLQTPPTRGMDPATASPPRGRRQRGRLREDLITDSFIFPEESGGVPINEADPSSPKAHRPGSRVSKSPSLSSVTQKRVAAMSREGTTQALLELEAMIMAQKPQALVHVQDMVLDLDNSSSSSVATGADNVAGSQSFSIVLEQRRNSQLVLADDLSDTSAAGAELPGLAGLGDHYTGERLNELQEGFGTLSYANGNIFEGHWAQGQKEGSGLYYYANTKQVGSTSHCTLHTPYASSQCTWYLTPTPRHRTRSVHIHHIHHIYHITTTHLSAHLCHVDISRRVVQRPAPLRGVPPPLYRGGAALQ